MWSGQLEKYAKTKRFITLNWLKFCFFFSLIYILHYVAGLLINMETLSSEFAGDNDEEPNIGRDEECVFFLLSTC